MIPQVWHLATNSLGGRPARSVLLAAAVALATMLIVAVASATSTISASVRLVLAQTTGLADLRLKHKFNARFSEDALIAASRWREVDAVAGSLETPVTLTRATPPPPEKPTQSPPATTRPGAVSSAPALALGVEPDLLPRLQPPRLASGATLTRADEILLDQPTADALGVAPGDLINVTPAGAQDSITDNLLGKTVGSLFATRPPPRATPLQLKLVGVIDRPKLRILQRPVAMLALHHAQALAAAPGRIDAVDLLLKPGHEPDAVEAAHKAELPEGVQFRGTAGSTAGVRRALHGSRIALALIAALVFLSAGFIITTSLTAAVAERTRELAVLRCIGASRSHVAGAQVLAGVLLCLAGAAVGTPLGLLATYLLYARHADTLIAGFQPGWFGVACAVVGSALTGAVASLYPAIRAARVQPLAALASRAAAPSRRGILLCLLLGGLAVAVEPLSLALPLSNDAALWFYIGLGMPLTFVGYFLLTVPLLLAVAAVLSRAIAALLRVPHEMLDQSLRSTPYRHGFTAGALMVGLAMLISIWTGGRSLLGDWLDSVKMPDGFVCRPGVGGLIPLSEPEFARLLKTPGVTAACPTAAFLVAAPAAQFGVTDMTPGFTLYVSFDPDTFFDMASLTWVQGDMATARQRLRKGGAVLVSKEYLLAHKLGVGQTLQLETASGVKPFEIAGVIASPGLDVAVQQFGIHRYYAQASVSSVFGPRADAQRYFDNGDMNLVLLRFDPALDDKTILDNLSKTLPGTVNASARAIRRNIREGADRFMAVASAVSMATLLIASAGVANLIVANIHARRFEFGVLRAVGAGRALPARLMLAELVAVALVAALAGAALGVHLAAVGRVFHARLFGMQYNLRVPLDVILSGAAAVTLVALGVSLLPLLKLARSHPRVLLSAE